MTTLSRRSLVSSAVALPALAVPTTLTSASGSSADTTLPPALIERFLRVRARSLEYETQEEMRHDEVDRRFYRTTGIVRKDRDGSDDTLQKVFEHIVSEVYADDPEDESDRITDERWAVFHAIMDHEPRSTADLAWQLEAWALASCELEVDATAEFLHPDEVLFHKLLGNMRQLFDGLRQADCRRFALSAEA